MNFRMLVQIDGDTAVVHRVVKHDLADQARVNRNDAGEGDFDVSANSFGPADVFDALVALGLPDEITQVFRSCVTEDDLMDALTKVSEDVANLVLSLYSSFR